MSTKMTARVPTTPETHARLKEAKETTGAPTFDALLRHFLQEFESAEVNTADSK